MQHIPFSASFNLNAFGTQCDTLQINERLKMKLPHPIQYQGSKRNLAAQILNYIPNNIDTLIEPFAGTAALSVAAVAQKNIKKSFSMT